jgi:hypothetical protein
MAKKEDVWVSPSGDSWVTQQGGTTRSRHRTQSAAIDAAITQARRDRVDVVVQGEDGRIRSKDSYGNDPNPPRDREH